MKSISDWKKSIIHITYSKRGLEQSKCMQGTAIFVKVDNWYFLITNKHLVQDTSAGLDEFPYFEYYFRIPSYDDINNAKSKEILKKKVLLADDGTLLLYSGDPGDKAEGTYVYMPHFLATKEFIQPEIYPITVHHEYDLGVISLRPGVAQAIISKDNLATELIALGYQPISLENISNEPSDEGVDIYTIGYPYPSLISERPEEIDENLEKWSSREITLPNLSFGKISMLHKDLPYFWCDMRISGGNSGGPVIENGKLVGIVYTRGHYETEEFIFSKAVKAKYIFNLLEEQVEKNETLIKWING